MDLQHQSEHGVGAYRHWPDNHPVVGNLLRIKRGDFRDAGIVPPVILDVALDFLTSSGTFSSWNSPRYILQTSYLATLDFRERRYICAVLLFCFFLAQSAQSAQSAHMKKKFCSIWPSAQSAHSAQFTRRLIRRAKFATFTINSFPASAALLGTLKVPGEL